MSLNWPKSGPASVPEYQLSGVPFVTSSCDSGSAISAGQCPAADRPDSGTSAEVLAAHQITPYKVEFPYVSRWVQVTNIHATADLRVGFTANGVRGVGEATNNGTDANAGFIGQNYFVLKAQDAATYMQQSSVRLELRCADLYFLGDGAASDVQVVAGLTTIHRSQFPALTGSTYTQATTVDRRDADGNMVSVQTQAPLFSTGSSGLG
jgi:hypothetical protein